MQKLAVFGGTGIIGRGITEYLDTQDDGQGIGVARHPFSPSDTEAR